MDLKQLATKPQLEKVTVTDDTVVSAYGEPVEFYMYDRQDLPTYLKLAQVQNSETEIFQALKELVLDAEGNPVLGDGDVLPVDIMVPVITAAVDHLGKKQPQTSA